MASMDGSESTCSSGSDSECSLQASADPWEACQAQSVNEYRVSLRRELDVSTSQANCECSFVNRPKAFLREYDMEDADSPSIINTEEARDLRNWCSQKSWSFCLKCGHLSLQKLLPSFRTSNPSPLDRKCKCGGGVYSVPQVEDIPLLLRNLSSDNILVLRPFDIHCGDYKRVVHGYRQRTGTFHVTWSALTVEEKIQAIEDHPRRLRLQQTFNFLMAKHDSSYRKFVVLQSRGVAQPYTYEIFTAPEFEGVECALWPSLYYKTAFCESLVRGQSKSQFSS